MKEQPCLTCTRVENPEDCDLKGCAAWREWWLTRWENMRSRYCVKTEDGEVEEDG